ncbi:MAG: hypothetical protein AAF564_02790 [Bacteroidota bacterium]
MFKNTPAIIIVAFLAICPSALGQNSDGTYFKVCVIQDKSGSSANFGTPQIKEGDFYPLFDAQLKVGGEIAFGMLDDSSNWPLKRFYVSPVPPLPVEEHAFSNRAKVEARKKYNRDLIAWKTKREKRHQRFQLDRDLFLNEIADDLSRGVDATSSDVIGALVRCHRFLAEMDADLTGADYIPFILFISDVEQALSSMFRQQNPDRDYAMPAPGALPYAKNIYVVNGRLHKGSLAQAGFRVKAFEGIASAIRTIVSISTSEEVR